MKTRKQLITGIALFIGVFILVNILSNNYHFRLDFTADKIYTLSKASKNILKEIKEPITVTAYFSEDVDPQIDQVRRDFKDLLVEYANIANKKIIFEFINPSENEEQERKAQQAGVAPQLITLREKDKAKQQKFYLGAVVQMGERNEVIPVIQPGAAMEYSLSMAIKKLSVTDKPVIGLLQGHGEPSLSALPEAHSKLNILNDVEPAFQTDTAYILNKYKTIAIIAPKDTLPPSHIEQLRKFVQEGGNLFIALNYAEFNPQIGGVLHKTGIEDWLKTYGLTVEDNFVIDVNCGSVSVQIQQGFFMQKEFPYFPRIKKFADHPATKGLEELALQFASTLKHLENNNYSFIPMVFTSEKSGTQPAPVYFDINRNWQETDFPLNNLVVAGALVPKQGSKDGKIMVVTDGDFVVNGEGENARQQQGDNTNFMVNSIDWLSDDTGLIDLRTKGITARMLDPVEDGTRSFLKYFNFFFPILLIIGYGFYRMNSNRNKRMKRMEARYV